MRGRIKRYFTDKGYGFIAGEDGVDYYFHISDVNYSNRQIESGLLVDFNIVEMENKNNDKAVDIDIIQNQPKVVQLGNARIKLANIKNYGISSDGANTRLDAIYVDVYEEKYIKKNDIFDYIHDAFCGDYKYEKTRMAIPISIETYNDIIEESERCRNSTYFIEPPKAYVINSSFDLSKDIKSQIFRAHERKLIKEDFTFKYDEHHYLYVTTYQGDNYVFYENGYYKNDEGKWVYNYEEFDIYEKCNELDNYFC